MQEVYEQVILTCTTVNVVIIFGSLFTWIWFKIDDHREKKRKEREEMEFMEKFKSKQ